jgi:hypothetical protein
VNLAELERKYCRCDAMRGITCGIHADIQSLRSERATMKAERREADGLLREPGPHGFDSTNCPTFYDGCNCEPSSTDKPRKVEACPVLDCDCKIGEVCKDFARSHGGTWNEAIWAAIQECQRLEQRGKDNHLDSWMGNAMEAIGKLTRDDEFAQSAKAQRNGLADLVIRDVQELPDRTSPDDWPEAMLVTAAELRDIIERHA